MLKTVPKKWDQEWPEMAKKKQIKLCEMMENVNIAYIIK